MKYLTDAEVLRGWREATDRLASFGPVGCLDIVERVKNYEAELTERGYTRDYGEDWIKES